VNRDPRGPRALRAAALAPVHLYRRLVSPLIPSRCRYHPSCSTYAVQAVERYGILRGAVLATWRLLRCNPWSLGGFDPVEAQTLFRPRPVRDHAPASDS
jgi:putative membrane protein insertion efficiency factor